MKRIYLDYNAATPIAPEVREAMIPFWGEAFGNPSSLHREGREAKKALEDSREKVATCLSCDPQEIIFTSGGTESVNLALRGIVAHIGGPVRRRRSLPASSYFSAAPPMAPEPPRSQLAEPDCSLPHVITTQIEHYAVLKSVESLEQEGLAEVTRLAVDSGGNLDLDELKAAIRPNTGLISVMFVNNETGNIYPIAAIGGFAREKGILFHTDAVQAVGKIPIDLSRLPVDLLSLSGHKIYGPKGVGALFVRKGVQLLPIIHGGAQESERRGGTENVPGIVGLGVAMDLVHRDLDRASERLKALRDRLQRGLQETVPGVRFYGDDAHRVANTLCLSFEGVTNDLLLIALDREGIAVSAGSACASGALRPSHVLQAMGVNPPEARGVIRFSLGRPTSEGDIDFALQKVSEVVGRLRA